MSRLGSMCWLPKCDRPWCGSEVVVVVAEAYCRKGHPALTVPAPLRLRHVEDTGPRTTRPEDLARVTPLLDVRGGP